MAREYHGTGEQAIEWLLEHGSIDDHIQAYEFLKCWNEGAAEAEWPEFYQWLDGQPQPDSPKVGDGSGDAAVAIGEHAFKAGYVAGSTPYRGKGADLEGEATKAWDAYDPPEHIKDLS